MSAFASIAASDGQTEQVDRSALLLMLSYIEAECHRLGATEAARHAAMAAALMPPGQVEPAPPAAVATAAVASAARATVLRRRPRGARLH
jgi:hypothetical protein